MSGITTTKWRKFLLFVYCAIIAVKEVQNEIYSINNAIRIKQATQTLRNTFFGYAVRIQNDKPPRIIIGAPKYGENAVGAVFDCSLSLQTDASTENCDKYVFDYHESDHDIIHGNNLFGATIDGGVNKNDTIFIGVPNLISTRLRDKNHTYFAKGATFKLSDLQAGKSLPVPYLLDTFDVERLEYYYGFAQVGFSMDVHNESDILIGVPGLRNWRGNVLHSYARQINNEVPIARSFPRKRKNRRHRRETEMKTEELIGERTSLGNSTLAGYAVTRGFFFGHTSFAIGIPNGNDMFGAVWIYGPSDQLKLEARLTQDSKDYRQFGSHFGSALCAVDVNGDGFEDLLIGAPNYPSSNSFDDGKVFVYLSDTKSNLYLHQIIEGQTYSAHRFGTAMTNLGKITLDQHESVAISSPYQSRVGVVYVFVWSNNRLVLDSRIEGKGDAFGAFGFSLSRAVDINDDQIPDFAVGDYRQSSVTIIKSSPLFYYGISLEYPTIYTTHDPEPFQVKLCIFVHQQSAPIFTQYEVNLDHRLKFVSGRRQLKDTATISQSVCFVYTLNFVPTAPRLTPLEVFITLAEQRCDNCPVASPTFPKMFHRKIPFNYNCKELICHPKLSMQLATNAETLIVGKSNIAMQLLIDNKGDPAFVCNLDVLSVPAIDIQPKSSNCKIAPCEFNYIDKETSVKYELNLKDFGMMHNELNIYAKMICVNVSTTSEEKLHLQYIYDVDVLGSDITLNYDSTNESTNEFEKDIVFFIKNNGPSPMQKETFRIRLPRSINNEHIIDIYQPMEDEGYTIMPVDGSFDSRREQSEIISNTNQVAAAKIHIKNDLPKDITCKNENVQCLTIDVTVDLISKDNSKTIAIPLKVYTTDVLQYFRSSFIIHGEMRSTKTNEEYAAQIKFVDINTILSTLNIWLIVGGVLAGVLLLAAIIYALKKLNFFNRPKHDKLLEEQQELELNAAGAKMPESQSEMAS